MCELMPTRFALFVINEVDLRQPHEYRFAILHVKFGLDAAADDLLRRNAIDLLRPGPHELDAAAGDDERLEIIGAQVGEQFKHRLVDHLGIELAWFRDAWRWQSSL